MVRFVLLLSVLLVSMAAGWSRFASAADTSGDIVAHGVELRKKGRDAEALAEFKRALAIEKAPRTQAQLALAEQALGLWVEAEFDLLQAFDQKGDAWIKKNLTSLAKALGVIQSHLGNLDLWGSPEGATVLINTRVVGNLPLDRPVRVAGGPVLVSVRADGYLDMTKTVTVAAGETAREHIELYPAAAARAAERKNPATALAAASTPTPPTTTATDTTAAVGSPAGDALAIHQGGGAPAPGSSLRPLAWVAGGGAVAAIALGVAETIIRQHNKAKFDNYVFANPSDPSHPIAGYCNTDIVMPECKPLQDAFNRSNTLMIVGYAAGGALAVGSAVLFLLSPPRGGDAGAQSTALACAPVVGGGEQLMSCRLDF